MYKRIMLYTILSYHLLYAQSTPVLDKDIKDLIVKIKEAKPSQKRVLINQLKLKIRKVNLAKKEQIVSSLKRSLQTNLPVANQKPNITPKNVEPPRVHPQKKMEPLKINPQKMLEHPHTELQKQPVPPPKILRGNF